MGLSNLYKLQHIDRRPPSHEKTQNALGGIPKKPENSTNTDKTDILAFRVKKVLQAYKPSNHAGYKESIKIRANSKKVVF